MRQEQIVGKTSEELLPHDIAKACRRSDEEVLKVGKLSRFDEELLNKAGQKRFLDTTKAPLYDTNGNILGLMGVSRDITERRTIADALGESEERYRRLVELSPDAIGVEVEGKIAFINPAGARMLGATRPEELLGKQILCFVHYHYHDTVKERVRQIKENGKRFSPIESRFVAIDGSEMDVEVTDTLISYHDKPALQIIFRDITERKQFELEREGLLAELREAFDKVNSLLGSLPICASCKKIRDDKGHWTQIETYIQDHSTTEFSHGICPECRKKLYPES